ncbi:ATP-dependent RNA helicase drs1 [Erysiphe neolycopersici]|uniref:RNA helicase n=1 Tax=Erysiphe neolycopersici TaxID=212602 RepID=A0A420H8Q5_9PEZI|nr:ATP-dependent RNA helicase drs1 [Erysiphe neolycopersici]
MHIMKDQEHPNSNMTQSSKRNLDAEEEFILTLSDDEASPLIEENLSPEKSAKKRKLNSSIKSKKNKEKKTVKSSKLSQKSTPKEYHKDIDFDTEDDVGQPGIPDDRSIDSDFEFEFDPNLGNENELAIEEFEGWNFDAAKSSKSTNGKTSSGNSRALNIDEILERRKERAVQNINKKDIEKLVETKDSTESNISQKDVSEHDEGIKFDDEDDVDEFLAEDGFGMGVTSDIEESGSEAALLNSDGEEEAAEISDISSVASPVPHPDDINTTDDETESHEDPEEEARRDAFFAPEEKPSKNNRANTSNINTFQAMSLSRPILRGLTSVGFTYPTPIQSKTIPVALLGKDIVGGAVTGSGKTAAFIVPILERLLYRPKKIPTSRVAILMPTRELAIQCHGVATKLARYTDIKFCLAVGGLSLKAQEAELRLRPDVIIGTPGRFIDHIRNSASFTVDTLEILVLDEADRMLEAGFADELNEIVTTIPKSRQTMLFSATMTSSIDNLIRVGLNKPIRLLVDAQRKTVATLTQEFIRLRPGRETKRMGYLLYLCKGVYTQRVIIFFRQKKEAHRARVIFGLSELKAAELHGGMSQEQRILSVEAFRDGKVSFLLATDLASRGLDIKGVETVINYEAPQSLEIYLHRVGRTARAGRHGRACTLAAESDRKVVKSAVKNGRLHGAKIVSRMIEADVADKWQDKVVGWEEEIEAILKEEKEEKQLAQLEMQVRKGENIIRHEEEIMGKPKRTWFESEKEKKAAQHAGKIELNGVDNVKKIKGMGKLSNKKKKKLDDKDARVEGRVWKKGRAEREGKGAAAAMPKKSNLRKMKTVGKSKKR